jgi:hypothetical protein
MFSAANTDRNTSATIFITATNTTAKTTAMQNIWH